MKKAFVVTSILLYSFLSAKSQHCDIQIEILKDKFMFGQVTKMDENKSVKKIAVEFNNEFMEILLPLEGENYLIKVINENCQAYCTRAKRVRQLNSGDEKLVKNLFKDKQEDILAQIKACYSQ
jgi:hypothetical protein